MTTMTIITSDDLSKVKVEIKNASVKHYTFEKDIVKELYDRFKYDEPRKIIFGAENKYTKKLQKLMYDNGYEIAEDGTVLKMNDNEICYNTLEHSIEQEREEFVLTVDSGQDHYKLVELLLGNGYIISTKTNKGKVDVSIYGKN